MERQIKQHNKECMKMAMLKQEETFRQQVHELHRLYRVQRQLMKDVKAGMKVKEPASIAHTNFDIRNEENETGTNQPGHSSSIQWKPPQILDPKPQVDEYIVKDYKKVIPDFDEESDLELTLAIGSNRKQRKKKASSFISDSASSFSSSSAESAAARTNSSTEWGAYQVPDVSMTLTNDSSGLAFDERLRHGGLKQPSAFLQCLSLKMS